MFKFWGLLGGAAGHLKARKSILIIGALAPLGSSFAQTPQEGIAPVAAPQTQGEVIARLGEIRFTAGDWEGLVSASPKLASVRVESEAKAEQLVRDTILGELINRADDAEIEKRDLANTERGRLLLGNAQRAAVARWVIQQKLMPELAVSEEQVRQEYERRSAEVQRPDMLVFLYIFLSFRNEDEAARSAKREVAARLLKQIREDSNRFGDLAREHSEAVAEDKAAPIGPIGPEGFVESVREPLWRLEPGQVSEVIENPDGLHIFKVERRIRTSRELAEIRPMLEEELRTKALEARIAELLRTAEAELGIALWDSSKAFGPDSLIVAGAERFSGRDLAEVAGIDVGAPPDSTQLAEIVRSAQNGFVLQALARQKGWTDEESVKGLAAAAEQEALRRLLRERLASEAGAGEVTEPELEKYYEDHSSEFREALAMSVRGILVRPKRSAGGSRRVAAIQVLEEARSVRKRWMDGDSFEALVAEQPAHAEQEKWKTPVWVHPAGKDRGWLASLAGLETGDFSEPIHVPAGFLIFQIMDIRRDVPIPLNQVRDELRSRLRSQRRRAFERARRDEMTGKVVWAIPDELLRRFVSE